MAAIHILLLGFIVLCIGVAFALVLLDNKINREARERLPKMAQDLVDMLDAWKTTDDKLMVMSRDQLKALQQQAENLLDDGEFLYNETLEKARQVRNRVKRLIERV